jgi:TetR/AcrR family transcriptional regulator, repressor of fatR-cypB operon
MAFAQEHTIPRRERERLERKKAMLAAAKDVFAIKGYEHATLDEVAERAEFGKGTLYNYFPGGKESILFALFEELFESLTGIVHNHFRGREDRSNREAFRDLIAVLLAHFTENRTTFLLLMKEVQRLMLSTEKEKVAMLMEQRDQAIEELVKPIQACIDRGEMKAYPAVAIAHMLMGNVKGYLSYSFNAAECGFGNAPDFDVSQAADFIADTLFDGLLTARA